MLIVVIVMDFVFFKQKTAYEMRISDWSSDVCSSDLCSSRGMTAEKGRGATVNGDSRRFNLPERTADGDWLDNLANIDGAPPRRRTEVTVERPRTIISRNNSPEDRKSTRLNSSH